jgi:hypothetical protein
MSTILIAAGLLLVLIALRLPRPRHRHEWGFYCRACRDDPGHSYPASATWNCGCGAKRVAEPPQEKK